jgi:hypothetical protein
MIIDSFRTIFRNILGARKRGLLVILANYVTGIDLNLVSQQACHVCRCKFR